jgi:hypothetical protein
MIVFFVSKKFLGILLAHCLVIMEALPNWVHEEMQIEVLFGDDWQAGFVLEIDKYRSFAWIEFENEITSEYDDWYSYFDLETDKPQLRQSGTLVFPKRSHKFGKSTTVPTSKPNNIKKTKLSLEENLDFLRQSRVKKVKIGKLTDFGWEHMNLKQDDFALPSLPRENSFTTVNFQKRATKLDIFLQQLPVALVDKMFSAKSREDFAYSKGHRGQAIWFPNNRERYQYIASRVRIQALQQKPKESNKKHNPLRDQFALASQHFKEKFGADKGMGINKYENLNSNFTFKVELEKDLNEALLSLVNNIGLHAAGDEKVFHFTGNAGHTRKVDSKKEIGLWIYEMCVMLSCGLPILIFLKCHNSLPTLNESTPTHEIIQMWSTIIRTKG